MDQAKIEPIARQTFNLCLSAGLSEAEAIAALAWAGVMLCTAHSFSIEELKLKTSNLPKAVELYTSANFNAFALALKTLTESEETVQ